MLKHKIRHSTLAVTGRITRLVDVLLQDEASSGKFLLAAAFLALVLANSPFRHIFEQFWQQYFTVSLGGLGISETFRHWIGEGLMAIFFLVVGLEIKREIVRGELRHFRAAILPIMAAIGGMAVPVLLYMAINNGHATFAGWGIPITTDTALAVGMLALLGSRIPAALRLFLLTIMVADDITAVSIIAIFYNSHIAVMPLIWAAGLLAAIFFLQWIRLLQLWVFVLLGVGLWLAIHASGVHASIAGALIGLAAPIVARTRTSAKRAIAERLERALIPVSTFVVIPLFALANSGVALHTDAFRSTESHLIAAGIIGGLVIGKVVGIVGGAWLIVRLGVAKLPEGITWKHVTGVSMLAGIGFTLSIFIAELAFESTEFISAAKISIFVASVISAAMGLAYLRLNTKPAPKPKQS